MTMLSAESYTDEEYLSLERNTLFTEQWAGIGFASEIPDPGDILPRKLLHNPLLMTRDMAGQVHVFANVCRHRGHLLAGQFCNGRKAITCPYHAWSYGLDGAFIRAPFWDGTRNSSPDSKTLNRLALIPIRFAVWYDIIFVNLSGTAPPFEQYINSLDQRWRVPRDSNQLRMFDQADYTIAGNWKLVAENFLDNYHLPWVHPEVGSSIEASIGLEVENIRLCDHIMGFSHPTAGLDKSKTENPLPMWSEISVSEQIRQDLFFIFPNICMVMEGNYLWSMLLFPDKVNRCQEKIGLYVVGENALEEQYRVSRNQLATLIYQINEQDKVVVAGLQNGHYGNAASQGFFNPRHDQLGIWFHQLIADKLSLK